jgi:RHH-type proline utilization regulon transcriptional repressor/proline dehydrogenase/delta 1-pyrroline-5-carboxylate dehydrogenase
MDQVVQALAMGNRVLAIVSGPVQLIDDLKLVGAPIIGLVGSVSPEVLSQACIHAVAYSSSGQEFQKIRISLAGRAGAILPLITERMSPTSYCNERLICINTTASGGNTSLLSLD